MPSRFWSREDIRNILLAIYAAKVTPPEATRVEGEAASEEELEPHRQGCRTAIQSLMLAFGLPLQWLDQAVRLPAPTARVSRTATENWWLEDVENIIAAIYRSAISAPVGSSAPPYIEHYRLGFSEVISAVLHAIGSRKDPQRWLEQAPEDRRWGLPPRRDVPPKVVGSSPGTTDDHPQQ